MEKRCGKCNQVKPIGEFHKDKGKKDGHAAFCKVCVSAYSKKWYQDNQPKRLEQRRNYFAAHRDEIVAKLKLYFKTPRGKATHDRCAKRHNASPKGRATKKRIKEKYNQTYPEKIKAKLIISHEIERGRMPPAKSLICSQCGIKQARHYHHPDYSKPLDVIPVCIDCHTEIHR